MFDCSEAECCLFVGRPDWPTNEAQFRIVSGCRQFVSNPAFTDLSLCIIAESLTDAIAVHAERDWRFSSKCECCRTSS
jgi:hypothetical protein